MSTGAVVCSSCGYENIVVGCGFCLQCGEEFPARTASEKDVTVTAQDSQISAPDAPPAKEQPAARVPEASAAAGPASGSVIAMAVDANSQYVGYGESAFAADFLVEGLRIEPRMPGGGTEVFQSALLAAEENDSFFEEAATTGEGSLVATAEVDERPGEQSDSPAGPCELRPSEVQVDDGYEPGGEAVDAPAEADEPTLETFEPAEATGDPTFEASAPSDEEWEPVAETIEQANEALETAGEAIESAIEAFEPPVETFEQVDEEFALAGETFDPACEESESPSEAVATHGELSAVAGDEDAGESSELQDDVSEPEPEPEPEPESDPELELESELENIAAEEPEETGPTEDAATDEADVAFSQSLVHELDRLITTASKSIGMLMNSTPQGMVGELEIEGRKQYVFVQRNYNSSGAPMISFFAPCGPASQQYAVPLLEWNSALPMCAFAIREIENTPMFVTQANLPAFSLDPMTIASTIKEIVKRADQVQQRIN